MGLTNKSTGKNVIKKDGGIQNSANDILIALAGNPNVGKSTVFNALTGMNQHTGNWPGKTVATAEGNYLYEGKNHIVVDLPGTYSLMASSQEEEVARNFICFGEPDVTVVVTDATCLERNLNLVLQSMEIRNNVVLCVNLLDEAKKKRIEVDFKKLSAVLGIPVVGTSARNLQGLEELKKTIWEEANKKGKKKVLKVAYGKAIEEAIQGVEEEILEKTEGKMESRWLALRLLDPDQSLIEEIEKFLHWKAGKDQAVIKKCETAKANLLCQGIDRIKLRDEIVSSLVKTAEKIARDTVTIQNKNYDQRDRKIDRILTSKRFGIPIMILLLGLVFWITITGSNYPSRYLANVLFWFQDRLTELFRYLHAPDWLHGFLVLGVYRTLASVVSVMLPPMAIFFPLFTLLEDLGYLPRVAFNLDHYFKRACACGKQALTMAMGFGCNAAGVIGCRIIDSPRERLIAVLTNNFVPCNGRFPLP